MHEVKEYYSVAEVAEIMGISRDYAYELVHKGKIPYVMLQANPGGRRTYRIPIKTFREWLEKKTQGV